jgi:hypothetical protein
VRIESPVNKNAADCGMGERQNRQIGSRLTGPVLVSVNAPESQQAWAKR